MTASMGDGGLAPELVTFIQQHIHSVRQLEVLLFLFQNQDKEWSAAAITKALCGSDLATETWLEKFRSDGLLIGSGSPMLYRYAPGSAQVEKKIGLLAQEYKVRPLKIIDVFLAPPATKMMDFMDAFKLKKESKDDDG